ncbi:MAG: ATP-dependent metalloprotease FtsH, cell division protease FtsH [Candidatus Doudnabacteria bacterium]|nr:ATP-dependent metalloprotease FtsH, cell division protease FtsH [Candidatus Doudnabacteria bacterium]
MNKFFKNTGIVVLAFVVIAVIVASFSPATKPKEVNLSTVVDQANKDQISQIEIDDAETNLTVTLKDGTTEIATKEKNLSVYDTLKNYGVSADKINAVAIKPVVHGTLATIAGAVLPFLIPVILFMGLIYFLMRNVQGANNRAMSFGQSQARLQDDRKKKVTFKDVAGVREAKEELSEVVEFLKYPQKFLQLGAKIPKGVLLLGSPGVGKTLLARAVAGEANVPFFHMSGSEFVEMFVGVGASRVRDLFKKAKRHAPCIVFIDEIDAVGRQRGAGLGGSHDEREQTLNQILVEMDGFETDTNVIVIAATNRPDVLDPALLRPGRFDRQVIIDPPDINDREQILKVHAANKPLAKDVELRKIAERTAGFSGADLANLLNEAAILAARVNKKEINQLIIKDAVEKVMLGPERKSHMLSKKEKEITAYHEGGHALIASVLPNSDPVHKVSVISRGRAAGYTMKVPSEDKHLHARNEFLDDIVVALGGLAAEKLVFNEQTTGASNDLKVATNLARRMVTAYGMSDEMGPMTFGDSNEMVFLGRDIAEQRNYSEEVAAKIDREVSRIMKEGYDRAVEVLNKHRDKLNLIAGKLITQETLEEEEYTDLVRDVIPAHKLKQRSEEPALDNLEKQV